MADFFHRLFGGKAKDNTPAAKQPHQGPVSVGDVFTKSVFAPHSYVDRGEYSSNAVTKTNIRRLKIALEQDAGIVGIWGESKSGKTTFAIKTVGDQGYGYIIAEGTEIKSVEGFWRHVADRLRVRLTRAVQVSGERGEANTLTAGATLDFAIGTAGLRGGFKDSAAVSNLLRVNIDTESFTTVRSACLDVLEAGKLCVIIDDFHQIESDDVRRELLGNTKMAAGLKRGKYVYIAIQPEALFVGQRDEQLIGRNGIFEFPAWTQQDLMEIARTGFRKLGIGYDERQVLYIERNSFFNPMNVQEICYTICNVAGFRSSADIPAGYQLSQDSVQEAIRLFAQGLDFFNGIIREAEAAGGDDARNNRYDVLGAKLNVYELVFLALSSRGVTSETGVLISSLRRRVRKITGLNHTWSHLGLVVERLASVNLAIQYERQPLNGSAGRRPLIYVKGDTGENEKLYVANPMLRVFLMWGYVPSKGIDPEQLGKLLADS